MTHLHVRTPVGRSGWEQVTVLVGDRETWSALIEEVILRSGRGVTDVRTDFETFAHASRSTVTTATDIAFVEVCDKPACLASPMPGS